MLLHTRQSDLKLTKQRLISALVKKKEKKKKRTGKVNRTFPKGNGEWREFSASYSEIKRERAQASRNNYYSRRSLHERERAAPLCQTARIAAANNVKMKRGQTRERAAPTLEPLALSPSIVRREISDRLETSRSWITSAVK